MLSLPKLIVLIVIVVVVWKVFKWVNRTNQLRARREQAERERPAGVRAAPNAEDMVRCPKCDTFVTARGARHCGRDGCPYPH